MARKLKYVEAMVARFPQGVFARIAAVLAPTEDRADFVRAAVDRELNRRERAPAVRPRQDQKPVRAPNREAHPPR
jgi:hypothetical protein